MADGRTLATVRRCPACLGVTMDPVRVEGAADDVGGPLVLDRCGRCGGTWFDAGEVRRLHRMEPSAFWRATGLGAPVSQPRCHSCHQALAHDTDRCGGCGWRIVLDCPCCQRPMTTAREQGMRLDACRACHGVWFDHHELEAVWRLELASALERRPAARAGRLAHDGAFTMLEVLAYNPGLVLDGGMLGAHAAIAGVEALAAAPEAAGALVEAAGEASAGAFEFVVEIISGFF